ILSSLFRLSILFYPITRPLYMYDVKNVKKVYKLFKKHFIEFMRVKTKKLRISPTVVFSEVLIAYYVIALFLSINTFSNIAVGTNMIINAIVTYVDTSAYLLNKVIVQYFSLIMK